MKPNTSLKHCIYSTVRLDCTNSDESSLSSGTGFIYAYIDTAHPDGRAPFIVTAAHVIKDAARIRFTLTRIMEEEHAPDPHGASVLVECNVDEMEWFLHPDERIDLAVAPFLPLQNKLRDSGDAPFFVQFTDNHLVDEDCVDLADRIVFIGYPYRLRDDIMNFPIVRTGTIATLLSVDYNALPMFLIDGGVFDGSSGSPVMTYTESLCHDSEGPFVEQSVRLAGVAIGSFLAKDGGENSHLGVAIKAREIRSLIDKFFESRIT